MSWDLAVAILSLLIAGVTFYWTFYLRGSLHWAPEVVKTEVDESGNRPFTRVFFRLRVANKGTRPVVITGLRLVPEEERPSDFTQYPEVAVDGLRGTLRSGVAVLGGETRELTFSVTFGHRYVGLSNVAVQAQDPRKENENVASWKTVIDMQMAFPSGRVAFKGSSNYVDRRQWR